jgi:hypothetical protein
MYNDATMPVTRKKSSAVGARAVSETVKRVNAKVLALLTRRAEINRRIRCLHRVVRGLRDLALNAASDPGRGYPTAAASAAGTPNPRQGTEDPSACDASLLLENNRERIRSHSLRRPQPQLAGLSRACRIALMEAGALSSLEEIRARIDRRGSFMFRDCTGADSETLAALSVMRDEGEIRSIRSDGTHVLWQRIPPSDQHNN